MKPTNMNSNNNEIAESDSSADEIEIGDNIEFEDTLNNSTY